jgi:hypothetical protein
MNAYGVVKVQIHTFSTSDKLQASLKQYNINKLFSIWKRLNIFVLQEYVMNINPKVRDTCRLFHKKLIVA